jgi:hypothetical protein
MTNLVDHLPATLESGLAELLDPGHPSGGTP